MDAARAANNTSWHIELPHSPPAAPIARAVVRTALNELRSHVDRETAELLVCELVTNAVEHTSDDATVSLTVAEKGDGLLVEVRDRDPRPVSGLPAETPEEAPVPPPHEEDAGAREAERYEEAWEAEAGHHGAAGGAGNPGGAGHSEGAGHSGQPAGAPDSLRPENVAEDGRGLLLIRSLSASCGSTTTSEGKTVWFTLGPEE
ncbi:MULTISPECIES: ATP-binding protein [unclassified Streptomyces]|uniref:ATP-binding protein n=1 Tax=unclassified Streptomyces TaxID=2593676 RepID=UPI002DD7A7F2|nr:MULTISPECIES: ATP-binding protein [unclassified Streptomyces]WSB76224.1 ATP-binding protein [Streptomyces sp. NBC_01775]WSS15502.1 ATP-binding protein [Streptomyces sp. NBC_01186]WSS44344.1 ATP-binding protein [Streptomyces sp. NBC_01187]